MTVLIDSKFKEDQPLATVNRIRNALFQAGIFTVESWTDSGIKGCYSVRIEIAGTHIGQNGKGVTREFALASGYAEFMERIQSGYIYVGGLDRELEEYKGFITEPAEKEFTIEEYAAAYGKNWELFLKKMDVLNLEELLGYCKYEPVLDETKDFSALPFRKMSSGETVYLPLPFLKDLYATNGTCAGNVKREALVQGFSEIIERNHNLRILKELRTPPTIPEEYLQEFEAYSMIREIRKEEECELIIKDCSLGTGFPVVAAILMSRKSHRYIVKFGAHPVFEIALERTLTEMLQGRSIADAVSASTIAYTSAKIVFHDNLHNVLKNASGKYHLRLFLEKADREFVPFPDRTQMDNAQLYEYCRNLFEEWGYEVYIRNCGYLGLPSYQIIIPGFSEIYDYGIMRLKEKNSLKKSAEILPKLADADEKQINTLFYYLRYKEGFSMENTLSYTLRQPLLISQREDTAAYFYVELCVAVHLKKWREAAWCAQMIESLDQNRAEFCRAAKSLAEGMRAGNEIDQLLLLLSCLYNQEVIDQVEKLLDWKICAKEIMDYCVNLKASRNAYGIYRKIRYSLKELQGEWNESNCSTQI